MKVKYEGSGEWNTQVRYTFTVSRDYNEEEEKKEARKKYGLKNWAFIAHLCDKYPYTKKDVTRSWQDEY